MKKVERKVLPRDEAVSYFKGLGEHYKAEIIESIPADQDVSLYSEGAFTDLCRGPHVPSTGKIKHFKLMKVAGRIGVAIITMNSCSAFMARPGRAKMTCSCT